MKEKISSVFTKRVETLMRQQALTNQKMANKLNMDYSSFWRKINGKRNVDMTLLLRLAEILGTSVSYLIGETNVPYLNSNNDNEKTLPQTSLSDTKGLEGKKRKLSFAYWGEVADTARDVAESGDKEAISYVSQMLNRALSSLTTKSDSRVSSHAVSEITNAPVMLGEHNENNFTFK